MNAPAVDWDLAARIAPRLVRPGPESGWVERVRLVESLRDAADRALPLAAEVTGLSAPAAPQTLVVDRAGWTRANVRALSVATGASADRLRGAGTAMELAAALALMSGTVLGQVDPWGGARPRLMLIAPNLLVAERGMRVPAEDFRLWVALHEQTHVLQFAAAPWLAGHLSDRVAALWSMQAQPRPSDVVAGVRSVVRGADWTPLDLLPFEQRVEVERIGAVMSLLEGHAEVAMDAVGPSVIPNVRQLRRRFGRRRAAAARVTGLRRVLRSLLGVDVKMAQYTEGTRFVRHVRRRVGWDGLNAVWAAPESLPTPEELAAPGDWLRRVHG